MMDNKPTITRIVSTQSTAIESINLTRHAIGYIKSGKKIIYEADLSHTISQGELFYLARGTHYIENCTDEQSPYEEICFYYSEEDVQRILANFEINFNIEINNRHQCPECNSANYLRIESWDAIKNFFNSISYEIASGRYIHDAAGERIKISELIYIIISHEDSCLKNRILKSIDLTRANFEQVIYANIFNPISINELAEICNRSLTSFKKEFSRIFDLSPHQWFLRQRLSRSRLLLIYSSDSIAEIGSRCAFPNTSHFIKLFKRIYGDTPASFRAHNNGSYHKDEESEEREIAEAVKQE